MGRRRGQRASEGRTGWRRRRNRHRRIVQDTSILTRAGIGEVAQGNASLGHDIADRRCVEIADLAENHIAVGDGKIGWKAGEGGSGSKRRRPSAPYPKRLLSLDILIRHDYDAS